MVDLSYPSDQQLQDRDQLDYVQEQALLVQLTMLTEEQNNKIIKQFKQGKSEEAIASKLNLDIQLIRLFIEKNAAIFELTQSQKDKIKHYMDSNITP